MNHLDEMLDNAALDLRAAVDRMLNDETSDATPAAPTEIAYPVLALPQRGTRRALVAVSVGLAAAIVGGLIAVGGRSDGGDTTVATAPESPSTTVAALQLATTPTGYAAGQKVTRPAAASDVRTAVFVKRDAAGAVVDKAVVRVGTISEYPAGTPLGAPPNLPGATNGNIQLSSNDAIVRVQFQLAGGRRLLLEAHHPDQQTTEALAGEVQMLVAALRIDETNVIGTAGGLPAGWELAAAGNEPENVVPTLVQAFEVGRPDGGAKIIVSNIGSDDPTLPYWEMLDTLTPLKVRGHDGFVSLDTNTYTGSATPVPTLIWQEAPGHWVTLRADGMTTDQLVNLADTLTPAKGAWTSDAPGTTTTTTLAP